MDISPVQPKTTKTALELRQATVDSTQPLAMSSVMPPGYDQVPGVYGKQQPPPLSKTVHQTAGKTVPFTSFIDQSKLPEQESESLSHLIEQLGLSPQEKDNFAHVWTAYQPTPSQIAARQVMHRDLPVFTGVLAEWPVFISTYTDTTLACGYSPAENLLRLQRCLKGPALEAVRSKLTMPKCVPQIMETLRLFYGRPELIINALLEKIRATPAPKSERLEALIDYGIAVNSICDNLEAANLHDHLSNPYLLSELVNRLPAHIKYQWGAHIAMLNEVNLKTFSVFMKGVVQSVSRVCVYSGAVMNEENSKAKRGVVHTHAELSKETNVPAKKGCPSCSGEHYLKYCEKFKSLEIDDRWHFIQSMGICRTCLFAHGKRSCRSNNRCGVSGCTSRHHPLLHSNRSSPPSGVQTEGPSQTGVASGETLSHRSLGRGVLFRIIPIKVFGNGKVIQTFAFIDEGSSLTLIEEALTEELGVKGIPQALCLQWTGNMSRMEENSMIVDLLVSGLNNQKTYLKETRTVKDLSLPAQTLNYENLVNKYEHPKGLPVASYANAVPRILIGVNNLNLTVPLRIREGRADEPKAAKTRLGWCVYGGSDDSAISSVNLHTCNCTEEKTLNIMVRDFVAQEETGITPGIKLESAADRRSRSILEESTCRVGGRFSTRLLWRFDNFELPDSYPMAVKRLECLERKMAKNPSLRENITKQLADYQAKGYAHQLTETEQKNSDLRRIWYLPLGVVINPKKPEKVRMIWDAAATVDGVSLNSMLLKGPDELVPLPWILFRFRQYPVAVTADITEMFHQILIDPKDQQAQRFLWRSDPESTPKIYVMNVATFGATCSPAAAQFVKNKNAKEYETSYPRAVEGIIHRHYVDDYVDSFETLEEASTVSSQVRMIHAAGGFNIRGWRSNYEEVLLSLGEKATQDIKTLDLESRNYERVLGMHWLPEEDLLAYSTTLPSELHDIIAKGDCPTKRQVLRCLMSFFDPLGLLAAFILHGKVLLQDIWRFGTEWDERIDKEAFAKWLRWTEQFKQISGLRIPRCYFDGVGNIRYQQTELHIFVDASEEAYAAAGYFRLPNSSGGFECCLVAAKTKVAPLKHWSIPRLELQAAVLGTRLKKCIMEGHTISAKRVVLWSDSSTVLAWIRSDHRRFTQFVACRVGEILTTTNVSEWRWVPSRLNVADHATKWGQGPPISSSDSWFKGPAFLWEPEEAWPQPKALNTTEEELRISCVHSGAVVLEPLVVFTNFSKWERLVRTMAYMYRWHNLIKKHVDSVFLNQEELIAGENALFRLCQRDVFSNEITILERNQTLKMEHQMRLPRTSALRKLTPYLDERGVLRVDSRVGAAKNVASNLKFPVILPKDHYVTELIIHYYHRKYLHRNSETVVNELRQCFYISQLRPVVKRVTRRCQSCKVYKSEPQTPRMAPLPEARMASFTRPFSYVGLDLFGPVFVKIGRSSVKRWVALFTCMTIRAVHVEVVHTLSTQSCIMSIRRFIGRRGAPIEIHSDNGTNFRGADNILKKQIEDFHLNMASTFTNANTKWVFIPPGTPHMGGCWERMVRSVKTALEASVHAGRKLDDEALYTLAVDAEGMVNSRPLTYLPLESEEQEALTPNHFLLGSSNGVKQNPCNASRAANDIGHTWNQLQQQLDVFWSRWVREYLPSITRRTKWFLDVKPVEVGDLVVIASEARRNGWTRGRVQEIIRGADGRIRKAIIITNKGLTRQAVSKLAVLDIQKGNAGPNQP
ncbi:uncharacterized protein LOC129759847 [Uranotaenia lowii]|uniref:uncharacterized protein LOC129759847 n=1 Tax=Uranotaenia lowii TaxID=190385 RepID=UPI00247A623F|nr:uncharacterized protein LOC129759847 [Uranotaenia lowii]